MKSRFMSDCSLAASQGHSIKFYQLQRSTFTALIAVVGALPMQVGAQKDEAVATPSAEQASAASQDETAQSAASVAANPDSQKEPANVVEPEPMQENSAVDTPPTEPVVVAPEENTAQPVTSIAVNSAGSEQEPTTVAEPEAETTARLEDIVVTATKRSASTREVAQTINALSGEQIEKLGIQNVDEIIKLTPGVNLTDDGLGQPKRITIRGVSAGTNVNFTSGTLIGDTPFTDPFSPLVQLDPNPFDMQSVEVLKGPQGTLFGGSGLNGMIRYVPERPQYAVTELKYFAQYTDYPGSGGAAPVYGAAINLPLVEDAAALRLMGFNRKSPGYVDDRGRDIDDVNTLSQYGYRAQVAMRPAESLNLNLMYMAQHTENDDVSFADNFEGRLERSNTPRASPVVTNYSVANLAVEYQAEKVEFVSQTSFVTKEWTADLDNSRLVAGGRVPVLNVPGYTTSDAFVQEIRLLSPQDSESHWNWLVGAFYYQQDLYDCVEIAAEVPVLSSLVGLPGLPPLISPGILRNLQEGIYPAGCSKLKQFTDGKAIAAALEAEVALDEKAVFAEVGRKLGEHWSLTLGGRYYKISTDGIVTTSGALYSAQTGGLAASNPSRIVEPGFSPKASVQYRYDDDFMAYLTLSRGFRFGGIQLGASTPTTQVPETYRSDNLMNYELGLRTNWLDSTLTFDVTGYIIDWKDPQISQSSPDGLALFIDNVGGARGHGVELVARYLPSFLNGVLFSTSMAFNELVTTEPFIAQSGDTIETGSPWPLSPKWQTSTALSYAAILGNWNIAPGIRHTYSSKAWNELERTREVFGYKTYDAQLSISSNSSPRIPEFNLSVNNLFDKRGLSNASVASNPLASTTANYIPPRAVILRISGRF